MNENASNPGDGLSEKQYIQDNLRSWITGRMSRELPPAFIQDYLNQYVMDYFDKESLIGHLLPFNPYPEDQLLHPGNVENPSKLFSIPTFQKPSDTAEYLYWSPSYSPSEEDWGLTNILSPDDRMETPCYNWNKCNPLAALVPQKMLDNLSNYLSNKVFTLVVSNVGDNWEGTGKSRHRFSHVFDADKLYEILPEGDEPAWLVASQEVFCAILDKNRPSGSLPKEGVTYTSVPGRPNISILAVAENDALKKPGTKYLEEGMAFYIPKNLGEFQMTHALVPHIKKEAIWLNRFIYGEGRVKTNRAALAKTAYYSWQPPKPEETGDGKETCDQADPKKQ